MGIPVLILGESGTGKSASLRNFAPEEIGLINVMSKRLPFKSAMKPYNTDDYSAIRKALLGAKVKSIVIDDAQYLQANEELKRRDENRFTVYKEIAVHLLDLFHTVIYDLPEDTVVYFLAHIERDNEGRERYKTVGKMTDKYSVEGMATICLKTVVQDGSYSFSTRNSGYDTVKTPIGMFEDELIENDLKMVDGVIRKYYGL